jgi:hypothetical protein
VTHGTEDYRDGDMYRFRSGDIGQVTVRLDWPSVGSELDYALFEENDLSQPIAKDYAVGEPFKGSTLLVKPNKNYWLWGRSLQRLDQPSTGLQSQPVRQNVSLLKASRLRARWGKAARRRLQYVTVALCLSPAAVHAQDGKRVTGRPDIWEQLRRDHCAGQLALREETGGVNMDGLGHEIEIALVALSPHAGIMARVDGTLHPLLLMPMSLPIGPVGPTRTLHGWDECLREEDESFRPFRLSLEPGLVLGESTTGFVRASFRAILHPVDSFFGLGAGFGTLADWQGKRAFGFSSELLLQLGACCAPPFWQLSVRRDQYPSDRDREAFVVVFGPTVW